jgi:ABC-type multidrug transport system ATPase subunit
MEVVMGSLKIENLSKTYPNGVQALRGVTLEIPTGMFGLLGPNGAGKSTLMRIISTLQDADSGAVSFDGIQVLKEHRKVRQILGFLPQEFDFYPKETAWNMLNHLAVLKGITNARERKTTVTALLQKTNLWDVRNKKLGGYSGGMKQRFGIAQALLGNPRILIVDEPTAGLDPEERNRFHNLLAALGENIVVILSTHIVDDVSDLCTNMAIINKGQVLRTGNPMEEIATLQGKVWKALIEKDEVAEYESQFNVISSQLYAGKVLINVIADEQPAEIFEAKEATLEDVYFYTIGTSRTAN